MAKISARGATKVAERRVEKGDGVTVAYVMCSDRRVLRRINVDGSSGSYKVVGTVKAEPTADLLDKLVVRWHPTAAVTS